MVPVVNDIGRKIGTAIHIITDAERTAGVTIVDYSYPPGDVRRYGALTGSGNAAANDAALAAAISVAGTAGGAIYFPKGDWYISAQFDWSDRRSIIIRGEAGMSAGAAPATRLIYTGTATPWIDISGAAGIFFENIHFDFSNTSFTGVMLKVGNSGTADAFRCGLSRCLMGQSIGTGCVHLDLDKAIEFSARECQFFYGNPSVRGKAAAGSSYSNAISFYDCNWYQSRSTPIVWGGQGWKFSSCVWTNSFSGAAMAFDSGSESSAGMEFSGCWIGDVTANSGVWIIYTGSGLVVKANHFGGDSTTTAIRLDNVKGFVIEGNYFDTFSIALRFGDANSEAGSFKYNSLVSVTTPISMASTGPGDVQFDFNPNYPIVTVPSAAAHQVLTGAGAVDVVHTVTFVVTTGADALTLADGVPGQTKIISMQTDGGDGTLTPTNLYNATTITFNDVGDNVTLRFMSGEWYVLANNGCTIA